MRGGAPSHTRGAAELGAGGHVHYVELDQFVGQRYLIAMHGPVNPAVSPDVPLRETRTVLARMEAGRFRPRSPMELSYAIVTALARRQEAFIEEVTREVGRLEQRVTSGELGSDPEQFLEELFQARHGLLAVRTMTIAAERLTVIAVVTLPITAIGSVYGMNIIVNEQTHLGQLIFVLLAMAAISAVLLTWAKRQGWW